MKKEVRSLAEMTQALRDPDLACNSHPDLFTAIRSDDISTFRRLISGFSDFSVRMIFHVTHAHWILDSSPYLIQVCALYRALECFQCLLDSGCPHDVTDYGGRNLLHFVFAGGSRDILNLLHQINSNLPLGRTDGRACFPAHYAAKFGNLDLLQWLDIHGYPVNPPNESKGTPFMWAAGDGQIECMQFLLKKGARTTEKTTGGWVPLHYAVSHDQAKAAEFLLNDPKVSPSVETKHGLTPMQLAMDNDSADCCSILIDRGCYLWGQDTDEDDEEEDDSYGGGSEFRQGRHILAIAASHGAKRIMKMLLGKPSVMANFDSDDFERLFEKFGGRLDADFVESLCAAVTKLGVKIGRDAAEAAVRTLIAKGFGPKAVEAIMGIADVRKDAVDYGGTSLLHCAAQKGNVDMIKYLLEWGVDPRLKDAGKRTALDHAKEKGATTAVEILSAAMG
jgi:ankyrin repeat protein